jgi:hypothetical protein
VQLRELREWAESLRQNMMEIVQEFDRAFQRKGDPAVLPVATAADVVDGIKYRPVQPGRMIYVEDESGGAVTAYADGTDWKRSTDGAVVS